MHPIAHEPIRWRAEWRLDKYDGEAAELVDRYGVEALGPDVAPVETIAGEGNLVTTAGIQRALDLLIGAAVTSFANANANLGVGDSTTAAAAGQTDLQAGTNKLRKAMDATFPSRSGSVVSFRATFGLSDANWTWNEWAIFNAASGGVMLNRKVENLGAKTSANSWVFTVSISLA